MWGQGPPAFGQGSPSTWLPRLTGQEEKAGAWRRSPCAAACRRLTPGLVFLLFTTEKLFQAMAISAVGFTAQALGQLASGVPCIVRPSRSQTAPLSSPLVLFKIF